MKRTHRFAVLMGLVAVSSAIALWSQSTPNKDYRFASPEGEPYLTLGYGGGGSPYVLFLRQYASGTAEVEGMWNGRSMRRAEIPPFTYDELEEVLSTIVSSGLHVYDQNALKLANRALAEVEPSQRAAPMDSPWFELSFVLLEADPESGDERIIRKRIQLGDPPTLARRFPGVREYQGLARLVEVYEAKRRSAGAEQ